MNVINFEQKSCQRIRRYLDSYLSNELLAETNHEVLQHLEKCPACAAALETRARVKRLLQRAVLSESAPDGLREGIQKKIRSTPRRNNWMLAVAAAVVLALGGWGIWQSRFFHAAPDAAAALLEIGVGDHVHCALDSGFAERRFTAAQMDEKLGPEYAGLVPVVAAKASPEYEVVVGHRCNFAGRQFVHLVLRRQEKVLSLVITPRQSEAFPLDLAAALNASGLSIHHARLRDLEAAGFETRHHLVFVVSNAAQEENLQLASNLGPAVKGYLDQLPN
jgi:mycothiol system anti-sigma-R factor